MAFKALACPFSENPKHWRRHRDHTGREVVTKKRNSTSNVGARVFRQSNRIIRVYEN